MNDAQLTPLEQWLIEVVAHAKQRPWWLETVCRECFAEIDPGERRSQVHNDDCPFAAIDAALDKEPT